MAILKCYTKSIYWHLIGDTDNNYPYPMDTTKHSVKAGDLIGYANNTGAPYESSGDHLHFGLYLTDANGNLLNTNNAFSGAIDPTPYFNRLFAQDIPALTKIYQGILTVLQHLIPLVRSKFIK